MEYSLAPTDDLIRFWRSTVTDSRSLQAIEVGHQSPSSSVKNYFLKITATFIF